MLTWNHPWVWSYLPPPGHSHPSEEKRKIGTFVKSKNIHQLLLSKHIYQLFVKLVKFGHIGSQLVTSIAALNIAGELKDISTYLYIYIYIYHKYKYSPRYCLVILKVHFAFGMSFHLIQIQFILCFWNLV